MAVVSVLAGMLLFALAHSMLASLRFKDWLSASMGERAYHGTYRLIYNLVSLATIAPILLVTWRSGQVIWELESHSWWFFNLLQAIGILGVLIALLQIDLGQFSGLSQIIALWRGTDLPLPREGIQTRGMYRLVRHPLYFFSLLALWPVYPMTDTLFAFNAMTTLYFAIGSYFEERRMLHLFGEEYATYQKRVPWIFPAPRLSPYASSV